MVKTDSTVLLCNVDEFGKHPQQNTTTFSVILHKYIILYGFPAQENATVKYKNFSRTSGNPDIYAYKK